MKLSLRRTLLSAALASAVVLVTGCSTTSLSNTFTGYGGQAEKFQSTLASGDPVQADKVVEDLADKTDSQDRILYLAERGRILSLYNRLDESIADYQIASDAFEEERMKADLSVTNAFFNASALASNDFAIPYEGYSFEKVMLHNYQAINYLLVGNLDFAQIELNRADVEQQFSLEKNSKLVAAAEEKQREQNLDISNQVGEAGSRLDAVQLAGGAVKNSFQNAFTFYLRGVVFEQRQDFNRAVIEYRRAWEIFPDNRVVLQAGLRAARLAGDAQGQEFFTRHGADESALDILQPGEGVVVVLFSEGFIQKRTSFDLPLPIDGTILSISIPYYDFSDVPAPLALQVSGTDLDLRTELVANLNAMALKSLKETYPGIITRQVLREIVRYRAQKEIGGWGGLAVGIAGLIMNRSDDRGWLTLPRHLQVARGTMPSGMQNLNLSYGAVSQNVSVQVPDGGVVFVVVTQAGGRMVVQATGTPPEAADITPAASTAASY